VGLGATRIRNPSSGYRLDICLLIGGPFSRAILALSQALRTSNFL